MHIYGDNNEHDVIVYTVVKDTQRECGQPRQRFQKSPFTLKRNPGVFPVVFAGGLEEVNPPCWSWSQADAPGEDGASIRGGLEVSCPTGGGHGRSLMTLISTADRSREPERERERETGVSVKQEQVSRANSHRLETGNRKETGNKQ